MSILGMLGRGALHALDMTTQFTLARIGCVRGGHVGCVCAPCRARTLMREAIAQGEANTERINAQPNELNRPSDADVTNG